jgi:flavin reductase (DIM6/NTAB) family NADH-FMN oxidoreductase RutF
MEKVDIDYLEGLKHLYRSEPSKQKRMLVVSSDGKSRPNIMTFGAWGVALSDSHGWCFVIHVWERRHTHTLMDQNGEFTVNMPREGMKETLAYCGKVSGRDHDKFQELGLTAVASRHVSPPVVQECSVHFECKAISRSSVMRGHEREDVTPARATAFVGQILAAYADKDIAEQLSLT